MLFIQPYTMHMVETQPYTHSPPPLSETPQVMDLPGIIHEAARVCSRNLIVSMASSPGFETHFLDPKDLTFDPEDPTRVIAIRQVTIRFDAALQQILRNIPRLDFAAFQKQRNDIFTSQKGIGKNLVTKAKEYELDTLVYEQHLLERLGYPHEKRTFKAMQERNRSIERNVWEILFTRENAFTLYTRSEEYPELFHAVNLNKFAEINPSELSLQIYDFHEGKLKLCFLDEIGLLSERTIEAYNKGTRNGHYPF